MVWSDSTEQDIRLLVMYLQDRLHHHSVDGELSGYGKAVIRATLVIEGRSGKHQLGVMRAFTPQAVYDAVRNAGILDYIAQDIAKKTGLILLDRAPNNPL